MDVVGFHGCSAPCTTSMDFSALSAAAFPCVGTCQFQQRSGTDRQQHLE